jgi:hypothetical protein
MSLGIVFKGPEGIVLAADSRVTLTAQKKVGNTIEVLPNTYDNATKLLQIHKHNYVGVVTYGLGAMGEKEPRVPHSYIPEFEEYLEEQRGKKSIERFSIENFSKELSDFFMSQWKKIMPKEFIGGDMVFLVGGFNEREPYGKVYMIQIPSNPAPREQNADKFGVTWGGQLELTNRIIKGFDPRLPSIIQESLKLNEEQTQKLTKELEGKLSTQIPYQFLPLQDCVNLSIFLIRTTIEMQNWMIGLRGVGGAIDVATITRIDGFQSVQIKKIIGQRNPT